MWPRDWLRGRRWQQAVAPSTCPARVSCLEGTRRRRACVTQCCNPRERRVGDNEKKGCWRRFRTEAAAGWSIASASPRCAAASKSQLKGQYCTKIHFMPCFERFNAENNYLIAFLINNIVCPIRTYSLLQIFIITKNAHKKIG